MPSMQMMMAASGEGNPITLAASYTVTDAGAPPRIAAWRLEGDGDISQFTSESPVTDVGDWLNPKVGMANYDARPTLVSGTYIATGTGAGELGVWKPIDDPITHALTFFTQEASCVILVEIRRNTGQILGQTTVNLDA